MKIDELLIMKAIALCFKPYLKPNEAMVYTDLGRTQLAKRLDEFGIYKSSTGYIRREDLHIMMEGGENPHIEAAKKIGHRSKKAS